MPGWAYGPGVAALLGLLAVPVGAVAIAWYGPHTPAGALLWTAATTAPMVLWAGRRRTLAMLAAALGAAAVAVGQAHPAWLWPLALGMGGWVPVLGLAFGRLAHEGRGATRSWRWRPTSVTTALIHRDLLALWRCDRAVVWQALGLAPLVGAVVAAFRINSRASAEVLTRVTLVSLAVAGPLCLIAVAAVARRLGPVLDPARWPTRPRQRATALWGVGIALLLPSWAAATVGGAPTLGPGGHSQAAGLVAALAAGAAAFVAHRPRRTNHGLFLWWIGLCLAGSLSVPPISAALALIALGAATRWLARRRER